MEKGFEHRAVGCHDINARSSRSHCLLIIHVAATDAASGVRTVGKLTLCDLAGSERITKTGATGLTLTEAQNINKSLLELGNVISALMQQSKHVPYRLVTIVGRLAHACSMLMLWSLFPGGTFLAAHASWKANMESIVSQLRVSQWTLWVAVSVNYECELNQQCHSVHMTRCICEVGHRQLHHYRSTCVLLCSNDNCQHDCDLMPWPDCLAGIPS